MQLLTMGNGGINSITPTRTMNASDNAFESIINYNYTRDEIEELEDNVVMLHDNLVPLFPKEVA